MGNGLSECPQQVSTPINTSHSAGLGWAVGGDILLKVPESVGPLFLVRVPGL